MIPTEAVLAGPSSVLGPGLYGAMAWGGAFGTNPVFPAWIDPGQGASGAGPLQKHQDLVRGSSCSHFGVVDGGFSLAVVLNGALGASFLLGGAAEGTSPLSVSCLAWELLALGGAGFPS